MDRIHPDERKTITDLRAEIQRMAMTFGSVDYEEARPRERR